MPEPNPTADYRKYPKGPNFGLIVILFAVTILIMLALGILYFKTGLGKKSDPYKKAPTPNSLVVPAQSPSSPRLA